MSNAMASHIGDNPQEQSSTSEKGKDIMIEDMEGATHLQDSANCKQFKILWEKLKNVEELPSEACIFKVHEMLRKANPEAYTPLTISIGPYHHGKPRLRKMERVKELYTQSFMRRFEELFTQSRFEGSEELFIQSRFEGEDAEECWKKLGAQECWMKLKLLEGEAKKYYGDDIKEVSGDAFVKMLLLDGCFIVEFVIRQSGLDKRQQPIVDPIFMIKGMVGNICRDMLLLENQLPFFVLQALYDMIKPVNLEFSEMVKIAFLNKMPKMNIISLLDTVVNTHEDKIKHLLQIVHILCQPQNNGQIQQQKTCSSSSCCFWKQPQGQGQSQGGSDIELSNGQDKPMNYACSSCCSWKQPQERSGGDPRRPESVYSLIQSHLLTAFFNAITAFFNAIRGGCDIESQSLSNGQHRHRHRPWACFPCKCWEQPQQSTPVHEVELSSIRTASELQEAGVHFKKLGKIRDISNEAISLFDIKFNHGGVLEIPSFALYDSTETFFRNLIAYEQHSRYLRPAYFTDYAIFMDNLINTEKDVNLLRLKGVFLNGLGDDKEVTRLFNNLCKGVTYSSGDFYYNDVCRELNRHCKKPWNAAMAKLRRNYFHSPWAGISTFAAILLLSLAIAQTVLSALQLRHK